jgi:hypothetical protein
MVNGSSAIPRGALYGPLKGVVVVPGPLWSLWGLCGSLWGCRDERVDRPSLGGDMQVRAQLSLREAAGTPDVVSRGRPQPHRTWAP